MSDPKWATDIANKKPKLSWDNLVSTDSFDDTGSATISRQTTGVQTEATYGHTSRKYLWSWTDFAGAIAASKSLLGIPQILQLLKGGKSEMISFADSQKVLGGKSRTRIGIKASPLQSVLGKIPFIGPKHAKTIAEFAYWKETQLTYGDRSDVIVGHINRAVIRGDESVVYSGSEEDKSKKKFAAKAIGLPKVEYNEGTTTLTVGASKGYMFATDKSYIIDVNGSNDGRVAIYAGTGSVQLYKENNLHQLLITTDCHTVRAQNSFERIAKSKIINGKKMEVVCEDEIVHRAANGSLKIGKSGVSLYGKTELGTTIIADVLDLDEANEREKEERLRQEQEQLEQERADLFAELAEQYPQGR